MKYLLLWIFTLIILPVISRREVQTYLQDIFKKKISFAKKAQEKVYSCCNLPSGDRGVCISYYKCPVVQSWIHKRAVRYKDVDCGRYKGIHFVCCPSGTKKDLDNETSLYDLCKPKFNFKECGSPFISKDDLKRIYSMNETAEDWIKRGFTVVPTEVDVDRLKSFKVFNKTHVINPPGIDVKEAVGGKNARRVVTSYLALIGRVERYVSWNCGGVIINRDWILSAAHCFQDRSNGDIEILKKEHALIRLGEYDFSNDEITADEFPIDFGVKEIIIHPQYDYQSVYHDLVLVKLNKSIPYHRPDMRPICLPWEDEADRSLVGLQVTLTGWGSVVENGQLSPKPQEVNVTVFDTTICDSSYQSTVDYQTKFPQGIFSDKMMCAGDKLGGKDACMGDSGGPIVYQDRSGKFTLAGIVSSGYGCGLVTFPGIYIPINKAEYLSWIKQIAFVK